MFSLVYLKFYLWPAQTKQATEALVFWNVDEMCGETAWNDQACEDIELSSVVIENHAFEGDFLSFVERLYGKSKPLKRASTVRRAKLKRTVGLDKMKNSSRESDVVCKWKIGTRVSKPDLFLLTHGLNATNRLNNNTSMQNRLLRLNNLAVRFLKASDISIYKTHQETMFCAAQKSNERNFSTARGSVPTHPFVFAVMRVVQSARFLMPVILVPVSLPM